MALKTERITVSGVEIDLARGGSGRPVLYLHGGLGLDRAEAFLDAMQGGCDLIAPSHPGFGASDWPRNFKTVDDLAYFTLDLADQLGLEDASLVGSSFGGWIALEMMVRSTHRFSRLVLVDSLGVKFSDRLTRDIADLHALYKVEAKKLLFADPAFDERDLTVLSDAALSAIAQNREAEVWYGWKPYMHSPALLKWLHRANLPTLVAWGASDGVVTPDYGRKLTKALPDAKFELIEGAGHYPHLEQPAALSKLIFDFMGGGS
jgi:pimeloyl-ACP methyl ester carboxylesterase